MEVDHTDEITCCVCGGMLSYGGRVKEGEEEGIPSERCTKISAARKRGHQTIVLVRCIQCNSSSLAKSTF